LPFTKPRPRLGIEKPSAGENQLTTKRERETNKMGKQYYFAVCVKENGLAYIDYDMEINNNTGNVWDGETKEWLNGWDDENHAGNDRAATILRDLLKGEAR
jgi:hypothetical protein